MGISILFERRPSTGLSPSLSLEWMFSSELLFFCFLIGSSGLPGFLLDSKIFSLNVLGCAKLSLTC